MNRSNSSKGPDPYFVASYESRTATVDTAIQTDQNTLRFVKHLSHPSIHKYEPWSMLSNGLACGISGFRLRMARRCPSTPTQVLQAVGDHGNDLTVSRLDDRRIEGIISHTLVGCLTWWCLRKVTPSFSEEMPRRGYHYSTPFRPRIPH